MMPLKRAATFVFSFSLLLSVAGCATAPENKSAGAYFKEGEEYYASKHYEDAIAEWKKVKENFSSPELTTRAELKIADAQFESGNYIEAAASYEEFRKLHPDHGEAPYALYRLGLCYYRQITGIDTDQTAVKNAAATFENFLQQYPDSPLGKEARDKLRDCRLKQSQYEIYVGRFYLRTDKYKAAIKRLTGELSEFPHSSANDEALFYLGEAYMFSGDKTKSRDTFLRLTKEFDSSAYIEKAKKFMENNY